jgi:transposase-like protein
MLSDKLQHRKSPPRRSKNAVRKQYSDSQKLEAVKLHLITGNLNLVAASLNLPIQTLKTWRYSKWWGEIAQELKNEGRIQLSSNLRKVAEKALNVTVDRLEYGDFQYDPKTGEMVRRPVSMKDAHRVSVDLLNKSLELEDQPVQEEAMKATQDRLQALAETFASFSKKVKRIEVIDIEPQP